MSDEEDLPDSTDDEDYVPSEGEAVSEEENSGDEENFDALRDDGEPAASGKRKRKSPKKKTSPVRKRRGGIKLEDEQEEVGVVEDKNVELQQQIIAEGEAKKEEHAKKRADDLWSSFMSDVGKRPEKKPELAPGGSLANIMSKAPTPSKPDPFVSPGGKPMSSAPQASTAPAKSTITVTKVYDFAGETVQVTKELDVNSKEAQAELRKKQEGVAGASSTDSPTAASGGLKRPSAGGLGGVLAKINKPPKMGTLEKSKLDWESFKQKEGIDEELKIHNRGKQSYIERMNFLQRTDQRQYEIERNLRLGSSTSKR
ncbi:craniofacial development protein 1-like [Dreissena polymorpha]|uniref:Craniofacial development protein 1 n=1 Tax=Dreissena polymorpha TaxID=45954 RepID=A0A9D4IPB5_DREPO|nr:craniofacial development protein 1-like [Dreissena polymorpha]KAH3778893.1 hypothetical protein DPMN_180370 [Dreissena polymorpha]